eukprot:3138234-Amphidinium_carterae.2
MQNRHVTHVRPLAQRLELARNNSKAVKGWMRAFQSLAARSWVMSHDFPFSPKIQRRGMGVPVKRPEFSASPISATSHVFGVPRCKNDGVHSKEGAPSENGPQGLEGALSNATPTATAM